MQTLEGSVPAQQAPTRITAARGKLVVKRDPAPTTAGSLYIPEAAQDKRGAKVRGAWGTVRSVGAPCDAFPAPADADYAVGQRVLYEESSEHGASDYVPSLEPDLVVVRQDKVLAVEVAS